MKTLLLLSLLTLTACDVATAPAPQSVTRWALAVPPNQNYLVDTFSVVNGLPDSDWSWPDVSDSIAPNGRAIPHYAYHSRKIPVVASIPAQYISTPKGYTVFAYSSYAGLVTYSMNASSDTVAVATVDSAAKFGASTLFYNKVP